MSGGLRKTGFLIIWLLLQSRLLLAQGDFERGRRLFTGKEPFSNGGIPCISCHSIKGEFSFGGGTLGPDLKDAFENYGEDGIKEVLQDIPFPTMEPIYKRHPLTEEEIINIAEFLKEAGGVEKNPLPLSFLAFILFLLIQMVVWRNRLRPAREDLKGD